MSSFKLYAIPILISEHDAKGLARARAIIESQMVRYVFNISEAAWQLITL